jgi:hypothetical protein
MWYLSLSPTGKPGCAWKQEGETCELNQIVNFRDFTTGQKNVKQIFLNKLK